MKPKQFILTTLIGFVTCAATVFAYHISYSSKTAYIDLNKVFNGFTMKKELEAKYKITSQQRESMLDSLALRLQILSQKINDLGTNVKPADTVLISQFEHHQRDYLSLKSRFRDDNESMTKQLDQQILERLNQYVAEFGKNKKYDFIYGATGDGNIMFSNEVHNVSDEVITYINNKYKGLD